MTLSISSNNLIKIRQSRTTLNAGQSSLFFPEIHFKNRKWLIIQGRIQDFKLRGAHLKKLRRAEGGVKIFGVFRVKNHDFTPKNHIFPIAEGGTKVFGGISCEKLRFYAKKSYFFPNHIKSNKFYLKSKYL